MIIWNSNSLGAIAISENMFGQGTGPIHLDDLTCNGQEKRLVECSRYSTCQHDEDAGVICTRGISILMV